MINVCIGIFIFIILICGAAIFWANLLEKRKYLRLIEEQLACFSKSKGCRKGRVVGYKKLKQLSFGKFQSPRYSQFIWKRNVWHFSDEIPTPENTNGIYVNKDINDSELSHYDGVLVKIEGDGWYVEHTRGYRIHRARILEVFG